jgi:ABC-type branched-subunit amino acid transport system ATPase component
MATTAYVLRQGEITYTGAADALLDRGLFSQYLGD